MSECTGQEMAQAFALLADVWRSACGEEIERLRKLEAAPETVDYLRGMADAYARIARVADETAQTMKTGEAPVDPTAAKGAMNEAIKHLYRDLRDGKWSGQ